METPLETDIQTSFGIGTNENSATNIHMVEQLYLEYPLSYLEDFPIGR